jgi:hypothetical protein
MPIQRIAVAKKKSLQCERVLRVVRVSRMFWCVLEETNRAVLLNEGRDGSDAVENLVSPILLKIDDKRESIVVRL